MRFVECPAVSPERLLPAESALTAYRLFLFFLFFLVFFAAAPLTAQFTQFRAPGSQAERKSDVHEELREALADSRWQAGPLYIDPWIGIRELTWVDNVFAAERRRGLGLHDDDRCGATLLRTGR